MKFMKKLGNLLVVAVALVCSMFNVAGAETVKPVPAQKEHLALVSKASAKDKVYLSFAADAVDNKAMEMAHYSHRSHSSHVSHASHSSHYSQYKPTY